MAAFAAGVILTSRAAEPIFSGPQPGERTTGFKVAAVPSSTERDPIAENHGKPVVLVFLHALERSLVPLLRVVDEYAASRSNHLNAEVVFLADDRIAGEERMKAAQGSLKLKAKAGLSLDGAEGPGNYGLNKDCMMTIVIAKDNRVTDNFALVQPGIADAPKVLAALAKASGDANPPAADALLARTGGEGMRRQEMRREGNDPFPGAVPADEKLTGLLRQFIRPTNDEAAVNRALEEVKAYIKDNPDLQKQAIDGWTRVLHFGERYGTPYSRKAGAEFLESLKKSTEPKQ
jgi:hypothetical protein